MKNTNTNQTIDQKMAESVTVKTHHAAGITNFNTNEPRTKQRPSKSTSPLQGAYSFSIV